MSPEDREALLEQLGLGGVDDRRRGVDGGTEPSTGTRAPTTRTRAPARRRAAPAAATSDKTLKPEDSVLIDIDFKKDKPAAHREPRAPGLPPDHHSRRTGPVLEPTERLELQAAHRPRALAQSLPARFLGRAAAARFRADHAGRPRRSSRRRTGFRPISAFRKLDVKVTKLPVRKVGHGRPQAVRLRPVQGQLVDFRAGHRRAGALRLHRRARATSSSCSCSAARTAPCG